MLAYLHLEYCIFSRVQNKYFCMLYSSQFEQSEFLHVRLKKTKIGFVLNSSEELGRSCLNAVRSCISFRAKLIFIFVWCLFNWVIKLGAPSNANNNCNAEVELHCAVFVSGVDVWLETSGSWPVPWESSKYEGMYCYTRNSTFHRDDLRSWSIVKIFGNECQLNVV